MLLQYKEVVGMGVESSINSIWTDRSDMTVYVLYDAFIKQTQTKDKCVSILPWFKTKKSVLQHRNILIVTLN